MLSAVSINELFFNTKIELDAISRFMGEFAKLRKAIISFVMFVRLSDPPPVRPNGTTRLPLGGFS